MLKKIIEPLFAIVLMVTIPAEFVGVMGMESDAGVWAWWLCVVCAVLQLTAIVAVHVAARMEKQSPSRGDNSLRLSPTAKSTSLGEGGYGTLRGRGKISAKN